MAIATRPKANSHHHRKAIGAHHRHSKHYLKAYWPYIPLAAILAIGLVVNTVWTDRSHVLGASTGLDAQQLLTDTNHQRTADQENTLALNARLSAAAQAKANDMVTRNYWSHTTPNGDQPWTFLTKAGYNYAAAGENLAYGFDSANSTVTGWMNSSEHRANILNADFSQVGFGIASSQNYQNSGPATVVVAFYAAPSTVSLLDPGDAPSAQTDSTETTLAVSRVAVLSGGNQWSFLIMFTVAGAAILLFTVRHTKAIYAQIARGEAYLLHHKLLDITLLALGVLGIVLTRTAGFIH